MHLPRTMMRSLPIWMRHKWYTVKHQAGSDINGFFILYSPSTHSEFPFSLCPLLCHHSCPLQYLSSCFYCQERSNIYEPSGTYSARTNTSCLLALCHKIVLHLLLLLCLPHCEFMNFCPAIPNHCSRSSSPICQSDAMSKCW